MGLLDDLVKLQFLGPTAEAITSIGNTIIRGRSAPIIADALSRFQIDETGAAKPGAQTAIELLSPENIVSITGKAIGDLFTTSEGKATPEIKQFQDISEMILNAAGLAEQRRRTLTQEKQAEEMTAYRKFLAQQKEEESEVDTQAVRTSIMSQLDTNPLLQPVAAKIGNLVPKYIRDGNWDFQGLARAALGKGAPEGNVSLVANELAKAHFGKTETQEEKNKKVISDLTQKALQLWESERMLKGFIGLETPEELVQKNAFVNKYVSQAAKPYGIAGGTNDPFDVRPLLTPTPQGGTPANPQPIVPPTAPGSAGSELKINPSAPYRMQFAPSPSEEIARRIMERYIDVNAVDFVRKKTTK